MKKNTNLAEFCKIIIILVIALALTGLVFALPNSLNLQGKLTSSSGALQTGTFNFTFRIYDDFTSGNLLYETNVTSTTDSRGVYDIILENINLPFDKQYYLAVKVNADAEMSPRVNLTSVPYSFKANESEGLNGSNDSTINGNINLTSAGNVQAAGTIMGNVLQAVSSLD